MTEPVALTKRGDADLAAIEVRARELMFATFHLPKEFWTFRWNRSCRRFGVCVYPWRDMSGVLRSIGRIELSRPFCLINPLEDIEDAIRHEIAHALTGPMPGDHHGEKWLAMCKVTGCRPESRCKGKRIVPARWQGKCPNCGMTHHRYKKPDPGYAYNCIHCGPDLGVIDFVDTVR